MMKPWYPSVKDYGSWWIGEEESLKTLNMRASALSTKPLSPDTSQPVRMPNLNRVTGQVAGSVPKTVAGLWVEDW